MKEIKGLISLHNEVKNYATNTNLFQSSNNFKSNGYILLARTNYHHTQGKLSVKNVNNCFLPD